MTIDTTPTLAEVELAEAAWENGGKAEAEQLGADWDDWAEAEAAEQLSTNLSRFLDQFAAAIDHVTTAQLERAEGALVRHQVGRA